MRCAPGTRKVIPCSSSPASWSKNGGVSRDEIQRLDEAVRKEADAAARFALESPLPDPKAALNFAYAGRGN